MPEISGRLEMAAEMVRKGSSIADIGTDHAYLPVYLISNNIAVKALACDLRKGPLCNAEKAVRKAGLSDRITLRLSEGFDSIEPDEADDFIICGMGGTLIAELLGRTQWLKNSRYRLIIQPQSHSEDVRKYLIENGYEIVEERVCEDSGRVYNAMSAEYSGKVKEYSKSYIYTGTLPELKNDIADRILLKNLKYLKTVEEAERKFKSTEKADELREIIEEIEVITNGKS